MAWMQNVTEDSNITCFSVNRTKPQEVLNRTYSMGKAILAMNFPLHKIENCCSFPDFSATQCNFKFENAFLCPWHDTSQWNGNNDFEPNFIEQSGLNCHTSLNEQHRCLKFPAELWETLARSFFLSGLQKYLKFIVWDKEPDTFEEAVLLAKRYECRAKITHTDLQNAQTPGPSCSALTAECPSEAAQASSHPDVADSAAVLAEATKLLQQIRIFRTERLLQPDDCPVREPDELDSCFYGQDGSAAENPEQYNDNCPHDGFYANMEPAGQGTMFDETSADHYYNDSQSQAFGHRDNDQHRTSDYIATNQPQDNQPQNHYDTENIAFGGFVMNLSEPELKDTAMNDFGCMGVFAHFDQENQNDNLPYNEVAFEPLEEGEILNEQDMRPNNQSPILPSVFSQIFPVSFVCAMIFLALLPLTEATHMQPNFHKCQNYLIPFSLLLIVSVRLLTGWWMQTTPTPESKPLCSTSSQTEYAETLNSEMQTSESTGKLRDTPTQTSDAMDNNCSSPTQILGAGLNSKVDSKSKLNPDALEFKPRSKVCKSKRPENSSKCLQYKTEFASQSDKEIALAEKSVKPESKPNEWPKTVSLSTQLLVIMQAQHVEMMREINRTKCNYNSQVFMATLKTLSNCDRCMASLKAHIKQLEKTSGVEAVVGSGAYTPTAPIAADKHFTIPAKTSIRLSTCNLCILTVLCAFFPATQATTSMAPRAPVSVPIEDFGLYNLVLHNRYPTGTYATYCTPLEQSLIVKKDIELRKTCSRPMTTAPVNVHRASPMLLKRALFCYECDWFPALANIPYITLQTVSSRNLLMPTQQHTLLCIKDVIGAVPQSYNLHGLMHVALQTQSETYQAVSQSHYSPFNGHACDSHLEALLCCHCHLTIWGSEHLLDTGTLGTQDTMVVTRCKGPDGRWRSRGRLPIGRGAQGEQQGAEDSKENQA